MNMFEISRKANELEARVLTEGYATTERDVAEAVELVNAYIDELEWLENTVTITNGEHDITELADIISQGKLHEHIDTSRRESDTGAGTGRKPDWRIAKTS